MNILNGTDDLLRNLSLTQQHLGKLTSNLASGLRIQSAADDPSGLAISENLRSRVGGLQQAVENVQTGGNLLTVADGAAATIQQILQRVDSLIVESNSDINSDEQLSNIQTEINQLLTEINHISSSSNFNGLKLFDGSHDTYVAASTANIVAVEINPGANPDGTTPLTDSASSPGAGASAKLISGLFENYSQPYVPGLYVLQVTGYSLNPTDPTTNTSLGVPGVYIRQVLYGSSTAFANGSGNEAIFTQAVPTGLGVDGGGGGPAAQPLPSGINNINFTYQNFTSGDVDAAIAYEIYQPRASGGGTAINVNDSGSEGGTIAISLPTLSTNALQIADISILRPGQVTGYGPTPASPSGTDSSNQYAAMDAQARVENAIDFVSSLRAQLGAQMVSTEQDANNDNINIINLTASESSIRDLNVGSAVTELTKDQILTQVGTSVLSQYQVDARQLTGLLIQALVA